MTSQLMYKTTGSDLTGKNDIDKLIKKFSNKPKSGSNDIDSLRSTQNTHYNKLIERICQENLEFSSQNPRNKLSEQTICDRAKFFNTLKSLFAIFDPECRGFIDINELNNLGAQKNEILNDVIGYLLRKKSPNCEYSNSLYFVNDKSGIKTSIDSRSSSGNSSRSSSANSIQLKSDDAKNSFIKNFNLKKSSDVNSPASNKITKKLKKLEAKNKTSSSSSASPSSTKSSLSSSINQLSGNLESYYVTFEEFVNAADIILDKRKKEKMQASQNHTPRSYSYMDDFTTKKSCKMESDSYKSGTVGNIGINLYQGTSTSLNNIYKSANGYVNKLSLMQSSMQPPPPPPPPIDYNTQRSKAHTPRQSLNQQHQQQSNYMPLLSALQNHNQSSSSSSINSMNGATLSQAFENVTNFDLNQKLAKTNQTSINKPVVVNENFLNNANSYDLCGLIDKENALLQQGLADIEGIKQWYSNQLRENRQKQSNIQQLKRQNLFSIDKMLTDLKNLNDLNTVFNQFLSQNKEKETSFDSIIEKKENISNGASGVQAPLPTYKDYVETFELNKTDNDIDQYLKEKSEKIDNLQREKSNLIRRLFEMKSESASLNRNIIQLQNTHTPLVQTNSQNSQSFTSTSTSNTLIKQHHQNYDRLPNHNESPLVTNSRPSHPNTNPHLISNNKLHSRSGVNSTRAGLNHSSICNFIELPNGGLMRNNESSQNSRPHGFYQQQHLFQPIQNRSPI